MSITIRLNPEEKELVKGFAKFNNMSVSEFIRNTVLQRIEEEYDLKKAAEAYKEYMASGQQSRPISKLWEELDL